MSPFSSSVMNPRVLLAFAFAIACLIFPEVPGVFAQDQAPRAQFKNAGTDPSLDGLLVQLILKEADLAKSVGRDNGELASTRAKMKVVQELISRRDDGQVQTWSQRLGWPADKRVVIFHADDIGMCYEANQAAQNALSKGLYRSAAAMVPCPWFNEMAAWCVEHPEHDVGLHLTLTSEWKYYRWGPVAAHDKVPGLLDAQGYLFREVPGVVRSATAQEVATEIRAQLARARQMGMKPSHIDTHMGTVYARPDYTSAYMRMAMEEQIPAMVIEMSPKNIAKFRAQGYPITVESTKLAASYTLPKLDDFHSVEAGKTYEEKRQKFFEQLRLFPPGLHEIIFHPSVETEGLKKITNSWQQRAWENQLFLDPAVQQYIKDNGIIVTNWKEVMARFKKGAK